MLGDTELISYIKNHTVLYDAVVAQTWVLEEQRKAVKFAEEAVANLTLTTIPLIDAQIKIYEGSQRNATSTQGLANATEVLNLLYAKKSELIARQAQETEDLNEKERLRREILSLSNKAVLQATNYHEALGDAFDLNSELTSIYTTAIKDLIDSGLDPADERVIKLLGSLAALGGEVQDLT